MPPAQRLYTEKNDLELDAGTNPNCALTLQFMFFLARVFSNQFGEGDFFVEEPSSPRFGHTRRRFQRGILPLVSLVL